MRLAVDDLALRGLRLELSHAGGTNVVQIARASRVRGAYEQDAAAIRLVDMTGDALDLDELGWHLGPRGRIDLQTVGLHGAEVDARIGLARSEPAEPAFAGRIATQSAAATAATLSLGTTRMTAVLAVEALVFAMGREHIGGSVSAARASLTEARLDAPTFAGAIERVDAEMLGVRWSDDGALHVEASSLALLGAAVRVGELRLTVKRLRCGRLAIARAADQPPDLQVTDFELEAVELEVANLRCHIAHVTLPGAVRLAAGSLTIDELAIDEAALVLEPVVVAGAVAASAPSQADARSVRHDLDFGFLDRLSGQLDVDVVVDAKIPILRRRVATHRFRVPILDGTLNYKQLERDLSLLENLVLDFVVRHDALILEKNVPLIPFDSETLVYWPLGTEERELAERQLVRVRTLIGWRLPLGGSARRGDDDQALSLTRVHFDEINAKLRLDGPGELALGDLGLLRLGSPERPAIGELRVVGAVRHHVDAELETTALRLEIADVLAEVEGIRAGASRRASGELALGALEDATISFEGIRPTSARGTLRNLVLRRVVVSPVGSRPSARPGSG